MLLCPNTHTHTHTHTHFQSVLFPFSLNSVFRHSFLFVDFFVAPWVLVAAHRLSLVAGSEGYSLVVEHGPRARGMWNPPGPGIEPISPHWNVGA